MVVVIGKLNLKYKEPVAGALAIPINATLAIPINANLVCNLVASLINSYTHIQISICFTVV